MGFAGIVDSLVTAACCFGSLAIYLVAAILERNPSGGGCVSVTCIISVAVREQVRSN